MFNAPNFRNTSIPNHKRRNSPPPPPSPLLPPPPPSSLSLPPPSSLSPHLVLSFSPPPTYRWQVGEHEKDTNIFLSPSICSASFLTN